MHPWALEIVNNCAVNWERGLLTSMEKKLCVKNFTSASITAVTYLPPKREVVVGYEGMLRDFLLFFVLFSFVFDLKFLIFNLCGAN